MTKKQSMFAHEYLSTGNATEAADRVYVPKNRNTAHAIGAENLRKPAIMAYLEEKAEKAASIVFELARGAKSENVRLNASKDIMDRAGYKAPEHSEITRPLVILISPEKRDRILKRKLTNSDFGAIVE